MMTREGFVAATKMAQKFGGKSLLRFFLHQVKLELAEKNSSFSQPTTSGRLDNTTGLKK